MQWSEFMLSTVLLKDLKTNNKGSAKKLIDKFNLYEVNWHLKVVPFFLGL